MKTLALVGFLSLSLAACGDYPRGTRNSDVGAPQGTDADAGSVDVTASCGGTPGGVCRGQCCGNLCCQVSDLCCPYLGATRCLRPTGVQSSCSDFTGP